MKRINLKVFDLTSVRKSGNNTKRKRKLEGIPCSDDYTVSGGACF